jgi:hypothetical protein
MKRLTAALCKRSFENGLWQNRRIFLVASFAAIVLGVINDANRRLPSAGLATGTR